MTVAGVIAASVILLTAAAFVVTVGILTRPTAHLVYYSCCGRLVKRGHISHCAYRNPERSQS